MTTVVKVVKDCCRYELDFCIAKAATDLGMDYDNEWDAPSEYLKGTHLPSGFCGPEVEVKVDYSDSISILSLYADDDPDMTTFDTTQNETFLNQYANQIARRLDQIKSLSTPQIIQQGSATIQTGKPLLMARPEPSATPALNKPIRTMTAEVERRPLKFKLDWNFIQLLCLAAFTGYLLLSIGSILLTHGLPSSTKSPYPADLYKDTRR